MTTYGERKEPLTYEEGTPVHQRVALWAIKGLTRRKTYGGHFLIATVASGQKEDHVCTAESVWRG
jgi:hypothetical protein